METRLVILKSYDELCQSVRVPEGAALKQQLLTNDIQRFRSEYLYHLVF